MSRIFRIFPLFAAGWIAASCAPPVRPLPPPATVPVPPDPAPSARARATPATDTPRSFALRYGFTNRLLRVVLSTTLRVDSASVLVVDSTTSVADLLISARADTSALIRADGILTAYTRSPYARLDPGAPRANIAQLNFVALRSDSILRLVAQPTLDNECDREETSALLLVSELLVPLPASITMGDSWTDVVRSFSCRGNVPMTTVWRSRYTVDSIVAGPGAESIAEITRDVTLDIAGSSTSSWPKTEVRATGSGQLRYRMRLPDAAPEQLTGEIVLDITVLSSDRPREPSRTTQRTVYRTERRR